jgi:hypothetical protein
MNFLLVNGIYDETTLKTLQDLGVEYFGFDLRGRSSNLIPFTRLNLCLNQVKDAKVILSFENDLSSTVLSFINLLEPHKRNFSLLFRDHQPASYYENINKDFYWMFHPDGDWQSILQLKTLKGLFLPLKWQMQYQNIPKLWEIVENRKLEIFIHADSFSEIGKASTLEDINLSVDLGNEVESSYRSIDQARLSRMRIWKGKNETFTL